MQLLGKWLFRLWLLPFAAGAVLLAAAGAALERLMRWSREGWLTRVGDRVLSPDSVFVPALVMSFQELYQSDDDGPGWSEEQLPRLWSTCRALAEKMGCPPPDAIHLSLEPGDCVAWCSKGEHAPLRRHIALSLTDLRLVTHDEGRAVIAHEIAHAGFEHSLRSEAQQRQLWLMGGVIDSTPFFVGLPVRLCRALFVLGLAAGAHDEEREADRKAAEAVGGNHLASALERLCLQGPVLARVFRLVLERALAGPRAPQRLAEAAAKVYSTFDFTGLRGQARDASERAGPQHPSLPDRVESAGKERSRVGVGRGAPFIDAYPELLAAEEQLTRTYFPDTPAHSRSNASPLRRRALAAELARRKNSSLPGS